MAKRIFGLIAGCFLPAHTSNNPGFELKMAKAEDLISRYHNALRTLAE
jgi:hypothetical protein